LVLEFVVDMEAFGVIRFLDLGIDGRDVKVIRLIDRGRSLNHIVIRASRPSIAL
jgi:hypothetical protein